MKKIVALLLVALTGVTFAQEYSRARVWATNSQLHDISNLGVAVDHGKSKKNTFFESDFSSAEIQKMRDYGVEVEILIPDVKAFYVQRAQNPEIFTKNEDCANTSGAVEFDPETPTNFHLGTMASMYTYDEFITELDEMFAAFPNLISEKAPINDDLTHEGRPLYFLKISDNPNTDESGTETQVMHTSIHHAREPGSLMANIFYMWYLLENYGTDAEVTYLVDNTEIFFIPMINPDGYIENVTQDPNGGGMHRKNKRTVGTTNPGVDLNRNYSYQWGTTGVSLNDFNSDVYCGTGPFSEPETQMMKFFVENHDIEFAFNCHTHGNLMLFPVGATNAELADDNDYFQLYTDHMVKFNGFDAYKSSGLYPASGDSDDYMYLDEGIFAKTPEIGGDGFWPPTSEIIPSCKDMVFPNLVLSHMTHNYADVVDTDASQIEVTSGEFNHSITRLGQVGGNFTVSVNPLEGISSVGDVVNYTLNIEEVSQGSISFVLNPGISFGDEIKYELITDFGDWQRTEEITKTFGASTLQYADNGDTPDNWTGDFGLSTNNPYSPTTSYTESPNGDYENGAEHIYEFNQEIDLTDATSGMISYYARWDIEEGYDYVQFQVSTNGGNTWIPQCGLYTNEGASGNTIQPAGQPLYDGIQNSWVKEEISLSDYLGETIKVRFYFEADNFVTEDGFHFDDFTVSYNSPFNVGLEELNVGLNIFPNPAKDNIVVALHDFVSSGKVLITDLNGKVVSNTTVQSKTNKVNINTANFDAGVYFVSYVGEGFKSINNKLIITK